MTSAAASPLTAGRAASTLPIARLIAFTVLATTVLLGLVLLVASLLPTAALAGRLMGAAGDARAGAFTQELLAHFGERLRFAALCVLALSAGLVVVRGSLEQTIAAILGDLTWRIGRLSRGDALALGGITFVALAVRLVFVDQPMRYDEALTFNEFASRPLYYGLSFYPDPNNHLLNTLLMHVAFVGFGNQPWVLRLPALLGGVLLVLATYGLGRLLYDSKVGLLGAALVAVSSYLVEYSTNGRGYTLQALCFVSLISLAIVVVRRDSPTALLLGTLVGALGAYALPTMLYGVAITAVWLGLTYRRGALRRVRPGHLTVAGLILGQTVALLYLPVMLISGPDKLAGNRFVVPLEVAALAHELPRSLAQTFAFWNRDVPLWVAGLLVLGFLVTTIAELRARRVPLGLLAPLVCLVLVAVQRVAPFERVWLFLLPLYLTLAAAGLARFVDGRLLGLLVGVVLGYFTLTSGSILASSETGAYPDAEAVARSLAGRLGPNDAVMTTIPASLPELQYYFPRQGLPIDSLVREPRDAAHVYVVTSGGASPTVAGWAHSRELQRLPGSVLLELERT